MYLTHWYTHTLYYHILYLTYCTSDTVPQHTGTYTSYVNLDTLYHQLYRLYRTNLYNVINTLYLMHTACTFYIQYLHIQYLTFDIVLHTLYTCMYTCTSSWQYLTQSLHDHCTYSHTLYQPHICTSQTVPHTLYHAHTVQPFIHYTSHTVSHDTCGPHKLWPHTLYLTLYLTHCILIHCTSYTVPYTQVCTTLHHIHTVPHTPFAPHKLVTTLYTALYKQVYDSSYLTVPSYEWKAVK